MNETLEIALGTIGFVLAVMSPFIINRVLKYKVEIEKLRQETEIRKEEIRAKNQLDIEKMLVAEQKKAKNKYGNGKFIKETEYDEDPSDIESQKERLRY